MKEKTEKSCFTVYAWNESHGFGWEYALILRIEEHHTKRQLKEAVYVPTVSNDINISNLKHEEFTVIKGS